MLEALSLCQRGSGPEKSTLISLTLQQCTQGNWGETLTLSLWSKSTELETEVSRSYRS